MACSRTPAPLFPVIVPPHLLAHLLGQGVLFLHDTAGTLIASIDLVGRGGNLVPREHSLEAHSSDSPWSRIRLAEAYAWAPSAP